MTQTSTYDTSRKTEINSPTSGAVVDRKDHKDQGEKTKNNKTTKPSKNQVAAAVQVETKLTPPSPTYHHKQPQQQQQQKQHQNQPVSKKTFTIKAEPTREGATLAGSFTLEMKDWLIPTTYCEYGVKGFNKVDASKENGSEDSVVTGDL